MLTNAGECSLGYPLGRNLRRDHIASVSQINAVRVAGTRFAEACLRVGRRVTYPNDLFVPSHRGGVQGGLSLRVRPVPDVRIAVVVQLRHT